MFTVDTDLIWIVLSFLAAVATAFMYLVTQYFKIPGHYLVLWQRFFILVASLPFLHMIDWPEPILFYVLVIITAFLATWGDIRFLNVTAQYGGGVTSRLQPLMIWVAFVLWFFVEPDHIHHYLNHPLKSVGIIASLAGCVYFATRLKQCHISTTAFKRLAPAIFGYGLNMVLAKYAFGLSSLHGGVFAYIIVQTLAALPIAWITMKYLRPVAPKSSPNIQEPDPKEIIITGGKDRRVIYAGFLMFLGWGAHMVTKNYANTLADNPGYVAALMLTTPFWIALFYKAINHKEDAHVTSGIGVVFCSIALSVFASL